MKKNSIINNLPKSYKIVLDKVISLANKIYDKDLVNIMLAGSGGKGYIIEGWSDLDLYIISNKYDSKSNTYFLKELHNQNNDIHVGTTFYTYDDFMNLKVDTKTKVALYEKTKFKKQDYNPFLIKNMKFTPVSYDIVVNSDSYNIRNTIQTVQRELYKYENSNNDVNTLFKKVTLLCRQYLNCKHIFTYNYLEVFKAIFIELNITDYYDIMNIIKNRDLPKEFISLTHVILEKILKEDF